MNRHLSISARGTVATVLALSISLLVTGSAASSDPDAVQPASYYMIGDANNVGTGVTNFTSSTTGDAFHFLATGSSATTLVGQCPNGSSCWGVQGLGTGIGVYGSASNTSNVGGTIQGVQGSGGSTGANGTSYGGYFTSSNSASGGKAYGVYGSGKTAGVYATTSGKAALRAVNPNKTSNHYAGIFDGNVRINGNYTATGTKSAVVPTSQGDRLMYSEEATQNFFSDQGTARLRRGRVVVTIDSLFAQTVDLTKPYMVIVTPLSFNTAGLGAGHLTATSFEVRELNHGTGNFSFSWRITALRKGYTNVRMASADAD